MVTGIANPEKSLEASDDGQAFRTVINLPSGGSPQHTVSFPAVRAKFFRVIFKRVPPPPPPAWAAGFDPDSFGFKRGAGPTSYEISELVLHPTARVNRFEDKAAFTPVPDLYDFATPPVDADRVIAKSDVIDLTSKMNSDGTAEATALKVDKLNSRFVKSYMDGYLDSYQQTVGADMMGKQGIRYVITDSWEAGSQNWTDDMLAQFKQRRGYDPAPWLPVLSGRIIESAEASDQFLWDFRKTIADLIADEHYGLVQAPLKERGIGHYSGSHEEGRAFVDVFSALHLSSTSITQSLKATRGFSLPIANSLTQTSISSTTETTALKK